MSYMILRARPGDQRNRLTAVVKDATLDAWGRLLMERVHSAGTSGFDVPTLADDAERQGALPFLNAIISGRRERGICGRSQIYSS